MKELMNYNFFNYELLLHNLYLLLSLKIISFKKERKKVEIKATIFFTKQRIGFQENTLSAFFKFKMHV